MSRSYAILGTGAVGGYYGGLLARAGLDVHFLLRSDYKHVRERGLVVESKDGDYTLPNVNAYAQASDMPRCDVAVVCLKTTHNHLLADLLPQALADDGVVLMIQNGLGVENQAAAIVGPDRVMGGLAFLCSNKVGPGHIRHLDYGKLSVGEWRADGQAGGLTDRLRAIGDDLAKANVHVELADDLLTARWRKLVWNVPYNGLSVTLDAQTDELMANPDTRALVESLMREVVAGANACARPLSDNDVALMLGLTEKMTPYRTSMKIDHDEGRPLEVEAIFGAPLRAGQAAGAATPMMQMLYQQLKFVDGRGR